MIRKTLAGIIGLVVAMLLTGCATSTQTATFVPTTTPTVRPTLTVTPFRLGMPSRTPIPPIFQGFDPDSGRTDFLIVGQTPDCKLPCWLGLIPGVSTREEVEGVYEQVFKPSNGVVFRGELPTGVPDLVESLVGWGSTPTSAGPGAFVRINSQTGIMQAVDFVWGRTEARQEGFSVAAVIKALGEPSRVIVKIFDRSLSTIRLNFTMLYDQGVVFDGDVSYELTAPYPEYGSGVEIQVPVCLDKTELLRAAVTMPFPPDYADFTHVQRSSVRIPIGMPTYNTFEDTFGLNLAEMTRRIEQGESTCVTTTYRR